MADRSLARKVLETEAAAIRALIRRLDARFDHAVQLLHTCKGRVIVTGMGKSGIICRKLAATLASTGTPAFFLHPAEAVHGDLGVIHRTDVVVAMSYSGETAEILQLIKTTRRLGAKLIAISGRTESTLSQAADVALDVSVKKEACPLELAPTASTTASLAMGDALAMTLLEKKKFSQRDFLALHPGGRLGRQLLHVSEVMHAGERCPLVSPTESMRNVIYEMSRKGLGMACVVDRRRHLLGIITDGDLRRQMETSDGILKLTAKDVMTKRPITIEPKVIAQEALNLMEQRRVTSLVVVEKSTRVAGVVHLHDLWRTEMI
ncbi:MAG: KpsF/GutQ family sugar-phosphate isomerase [Acidobacteriaceae bacterium]|jgi:arabinose-5-phosphate isomerase|nr:KpsF/GutQ family sugar-phosphate isomerase [Acidobacteriaceae bacterium]